MKKTLLVLLFVVIAFCGGGVYVLKQFMARKGDPAEGSKFATVEKGDILVQVVETGTIDAVKSVEVKSRVSGRLAKLLVDEGDLVEQGQLIAVIDPKETQLQVDQAQAQLRGAQSAVARTTIEMAQRRVSAKASYDQAAARLDQIRRELQIQPTLTSSAVSQARSGLIAAQKELERLQTNAHPGERISVATAKREALANCANAQADYERQVELEKKGYVPRKAVENAELTLELAKARLETAADALERVARRQSLELDKAKEDVSRLRAQLDQAEANRIQDVVKKREFESAQAGLRQAAASLRDVEAMAKSRDQGMASVEQLSSVLGNSMRELGETEIRAPIGGVVTQKLIQEGELVASLSGFSSGTPIVRIEVRNAMRVKLSINEIDVAKLRVGMRAQVDVDALPDHPLKGRVSKIAPSSTSSGANAAAAAAAGAEPVVRYSVEIRLDTPDPGLRSGMSAKCTMDTLSRKDVLRLPIEFVGKDGDKRFVMLAPASKDPKAKPAKATVTVGASSGAFIEVCSGVKQGQKLVKPDFSGPARKGAIQFGDPNREEEAPDKGTEKK